MTQPRDVYEQLEMTTEFANALRDAYINLGNACSMVFRAMGKDGPVMAAAYMPEANAIASAMTAGNKAIEDLRAKWGYG